MSKQQTIITTKRGLAKTLGYGSDNAVRKHIKDGLYSAEEDGTFNLDKVILAIATLDIDKLPEAVRRNILSHIKKMDEKKPVRSAKASSPERNVIDVRKGLLKSLKESTDADNTFDELNETRAVKSLLEAEMLEIKIGQLRKELVPRADVLNLFFEFARSEREGWLNFTSKFSAEICAELQEKGLTEHNITEIIDERIRKHLSGFAELICPDILKEAEDV